MGEGEALKLGRDSFHSHSLQFDRVATILTFVEHQTGNMKRWAFSRLERKRPGLLWSGVRADVRRSARSSPVLYLMLLVSGRPAVSSGKWLHETIVGETTS